MMDLDWILKGTEGVLFIDRLQVLVIGNQDSDVRLMATIICKATKDPLHILQHSVCKIRMPAGYLNMINFGHDKE